MKALSITTLHYTCKYALYSYDNTHAINLYNNLSLRLTHGSLTYLRVMNDNFIIV